MHIIQLHAFTCPTFYILLCLYIIILLVRALGHGKTSRWVCAASERPWCSDSDSFCPSFDLIAIWLLKKAVGPKSFLWCCIFQRQAHS